MQTIGSYTRRVLVFLAPLALLLGVAEALLRRIPNDYAFKAERMLRDGESFEFLILGSSHAYRGIDPELMGGAGFNAANVSQDLGYDRAILERYLSSMPNLKDLYIPISYGSLTSELTLGKEAWRAKNYTLYMDLPSRSFDLGEHLELLNAPLREQLVRITGHLQNGTDNRQCASSGAGAQPLPTAVDLVSDGREAAVRHSHPERATKTAEEHLNAIIDLATGRGIRVHLFIPPAWITYREHILPHQIATIRDVCQRHAESQQGVTFHDLLDDPRFTEADFADADHLARSGQMKLSKMLADW